MVSVKRPEVAKRIHDAKEHGDLSENAEYEDAKNEQAFVEGRIQTLEALIKNATIIDENHSTDHVQIGSTVVRREPGRQGDVHDRRLGRGQARRGPDLEREPGRPRPPRQEEGREGPRARARGRLHLQDRQHHLKSGERMDWADELAARVATADPRSSTTRRRRRGPSTSAACVARSSSTSSSARCARTGIETTLPLRRRRPRPDGRPGAPDARRGRAARWAVRSPTSPTRSATATRPTRGTTPRSSSTSSTASASTPTATTG